TFTKRKFNYYLGYQRIICPFKTQVGAWTRGWTPPTSSLVLNRLSDRVSGLSAKIRPQYPASDRGADEQLLQPVRIHETVGRIFSTLRNQPTTTFAHIRFQLRLQVWLQHHQPPPRRTGSNAATATG